MNDYVIIGRHYAETTCHICNGRGEVNDKPCWDCDGRGKFSVGCRETVTQSQQFGHAFCSHCGAVPVQEVSR